MTAAAPSLSDLVIERVGFGLFVIDRSMTVLMWNRFMQDHSGIPAADVIGRNLFDCFPDLPHAWLSRKVESVFQLGSFAFSSWEQRPYLFRFEHDRPITGGIDYMQQDCTFMPLTRARDVEAVCVTISDVTHVSVMQREREEAVAKLREHANRDGLTGIANRRFFEARLGDEFARWQRYGGDMSVLLFDLDHFKTINDRFGHAAGDAVLRETARRVASIVRAQDTFGRFGGEEFALLLPCTSLDEAMRVADKVRDAIGSMPVDAEGVSVPVTASVGGACAKTGAPTSDVLVNEADAALYRAKRLGRDRSVAYA
ncbi:diguanylate cyclase [Burkholderia pyrrocinia]|uniref:GGDEF domain-containing protein n=1 Tax=Burkholderia pyrrocinia TaxID=60550 RepID=UPI002AB0F66F|nr:diguanylate cyclase [Burkholderia pyrrocinia]